LIGFFNAQGIAIGYAVTDVPAAASLQLDPSEYSISGNNHAAITANDANASGQVTVVLDSTTSTGDVPVTLTKTGAGTGVFTG
jgi:hypothetical protein